MLNHSHRQPILSITLGLLGFGLSACDADELDSEAELALIVGEAPDTEAEALELDAPDVDLDEYEFVADLDTPADPELATSLDTRERWGLELEDGIYMIHGTSLYRYRGEVPEMPVFTPEELANPGVLRPGEAEFAAAHDWASMPEAPAPTPGAGGSAGDTLLANDVEQVPAVLLGADDRAKTRFGTYYPYRTIGRMLNNCTATLIGPRHLITAAHCVNGINSFQWAPGQDGTGVYPNGGPYTSTHVLFRVGSSTLQDYAVIGLPNNANIASLGWMGMWWSNTLSDYVDQLVFLRGYPSPEQTCSGEPCAGYMWSHLGTINRTPQATGNYGILYYPVDATGGQSGSAIYTYFGDVPAVLAVHKRGNEPSCGDCNYTTTPATYNVGARLTTTVYNDICWMMGQVGPSSYASHPCT